MQLFLAWRRAGPLLDLDPDEVASRLVDRALPIFSPRPSLRVLAGEGVAAVCASLPVEGWKPPFETDDGESIHISLGRPTNLDSVARSIDPAVPPLVAACGAMESRTEELVRRLDPPYTLVRFDRSAGALSILEDGLGMNPLLVREDGDVWAVANRLFAFKALGQRLDPVAEEWAARFLIGWTPLDRVGFRRLRQAAPGERFRADAGGVLVARHYGRDWTAGGADGDPTEIAAGAFASASAKSPATAIPRASD